MGVAFRGAGGPLRDPTHRPMAPFEGAGTGADAVERAEAVGVADEHNASFISRLFWCWVSPLIRLGYSRPLTEEDVTPSLERDDVSHHLEVFEERLRQDVADLVAKGGAHDGHMKGVNLGHKLGKSIWHSFHSGEYLGIVLKLVSDAATYVPPLCIPYFIRYAEDPSSFGNEIFIILSLQLSIWRRRL